MKDKPVRIKIWAIVCLVAVVIFGVLHMSFSLTRVLFTVFFLAWAVGFYFQKVRVNKDLRSDGVWWIPYFLVTGLVLLSFTGDNFIFMTLQTWLALVTVAFLICIGAILYFWEWPPWFTADKNLLGRGKRVFIAYLLFAVWLAVWMYAAACWANQALDPSRPIAHDCVVTDTATLSRRGSSDARYIVMVKPWEGRNIHSPYSMFVPKKNFEHIVRDTTIVRVWTKEGLFHQQWVSGTRINYDMILRSDQKPVN